MNKFDEGSWGDLGDDEMPAKAPGPRKNLRRPSSPVELESDEDYPLAGSPHSSESVVASSSPMAPYFRLYRWHPFTELFCVIAEWFEDVPEPPINNKQFALQQRSAMKKKHKWMFRGAVMLDFVLLFFIVVSLCLAVLYVALSAAGIEFELERVRISIPYLG